MEFTKNKIIGIILIAAAVVLIIDVYLYSQYKDQLNSFLHEGCSLPDNVCPFKSNVQQEAVLGYVSSFAVLLSGIYMFFRKEVKSREKESREPAKKWLMMGGKPVAWTY